MTLVNCRLADNRGYYGGSAASDCSLLSCVVKGNVDYKYNRPVFQFSMVKNCSVFDSIQGAISANSRITDSYLHGWDNNGRATYQRCVFREESGVDPTLVDETCQIVPEAELVFDEEGRPVVGANVLIDAGDPHVLPELAADHDASGGPRVTNGFLDFGALEADWTARYAADLGRRVTVTAVRGTVRDPGTRTVGIYTGGLDLSWEQLKIGDKGLLDVEVTGAGELVATLNGVEIGRVRAVAGRTTLPFVSTQLVDAISIVYLPDATDDVDPATAAGPCAVVYGLKRDAGLVLIAR